MPFVMVIEPKNSTLFGDDDKDTSHKFYRMLIGLFLPIPSCLTFMYSTITSTDSLLLKTPQNNNHMKNFGSSSYLLMRHWSMSLL